MTKPIPLPGAPKLAEVCEATWPPATRKAFGAWTIREPPPPYSSFSAPEIAAKPALGGLNST